MRKLWVILVMGLALTACGQSSNDVLPTLIPTPGQVEAPTEASAPTEAPTAVPLTRATLPPTWTPAGQNDLTTEPVSVTEPTQQGVIQSQPTNPNVLPTLAVCGSFAADRERSISTFDAGQTPQVFWTTVATAARYRVDVIDEFGAEIFTDYTLDTTYTFKADLFQRGKRFGWGVYPEDAFGQQMCTERGAELFPQ